MNKTFRVVFNRARGALMVANEVTSSVQKKGTKTMVAVAAAALMAGAASAAAVTVGGTGEGAKTTADIASSVKADQAFPTATLISVNNGVATFEGAPVYQTGSVAATVSNVADTGIVVKGTFDGVTFNSKAAMADGAFVTVRNGNARVDSVTMSNNKASVVHGLVKAEGSSNLTVFNSKFADNETAFGVIEGQTTGNIDVRQSEFTGNDAKYHGGAIRANGAAKLNIADSVFTGNTAKKQSGAVHITKVTETTITGSTFENNASLIEKVEKNDQIGGGAIVISQDSGTVTIKDSTFKGNTAEKAQGGAIHVTVGATTQLNINDSVFTGNKASQGGAIYVMGNGATEEGVQAAEATSKVVITDTDFIGNEAAGWGGALTLNDGAFVTIKAEKKDVTFSGNKSGTLTTDGAGARYEKTGDAIYINGGSKVAFDAAKDRTINVEDSIVSNSNATIDKTGAGKLVAGDMTGFVGALNVNAGSMQIAGGIGEYDVATQYAVNAAKKDGSVTAGATATTVTVAENAELTMGDVIINRSVQTAAAAENGAQTQTSAGTVFENSGKLTLDSLKVTTASYTDKLVNAGEEALAAYKTTGNGKIETKTGGKTVVKNDVTVEAGTSLEIVGALTVGSITTGAQVKTGDKVTTEGGKITGTGDIVVTGNAESVNAGSLTANSLTLNGGVFKTTANGLILVNGKDKGLVLNEGSALQFTELNSNEYLSYDTDASTAPDGKAHTKVDGTTYPMDQFRAEYDVTLIGGKLLAADGSDLKNIKIGKANTFATLDVKSGNYAFDNIHFGPAGTVNANAGESAANQSRMQIDGGSVTVKNFYALSGVTTVEFGSLTVTDLLRTTNAAELVNYDTLTVSASAVGLSLKAEDGTAVWDATKAAPVKGFGGLTNEGTLYVTGLEGEVTDAFFTSVLANTKFEGKGLVDFGDKLTVKGLADKADKTTGEFKYADISKYNGVALNELENATINSVTAENANIKGSFGNLKMAAVTGETLPTLAVQGRLQLNGTGLLVADSTGKKAVDVALGSDDTLVTTGTAEIGTITQEGTDTKTQGALEVVSGKLTSAVKTAATATAAAVYHDITVGEIYVADGAELNAMGNVTLAGTTTEANIMGKATIGKLTATNGEVFVGANSDGLSMAGELIVNELAAGTIFADPAWDASGKMTLDGASRVAVKTITNGTVVAGQASLVAVGTTDLAAATAAVVNAGYDYLGKNEGDVKSVVYVEGSQDINGDFKSITGNILATGWDDAAYEAVTTLPTGVQVYKDNLLIVNMDTVDTTGTTDVFASGTTVTNNGIVYLANAEVGDKVKVNLATGTTGKVLFNGDRLMSMTQTGASTGIYAIGFDDAKIANFEGLDTLGLITSMYEEHANKGASKSVAFNNWLMASNNGLTDAEVVSIGNDVAAIGATAGMTSVTLDAMGAFNDTVATRTNILAVRGEGVNVWADVNGGRYSAKKLMDGAGYASDIYAGVLGVDAQFAGTVVGAALTVGTGDTDSKNTSAETSTDSDFFGLSVYASHKFADVFNVAADLGYMQGSNDVSANYGLGSFSADTDAFTFGVRGEVLTEVAGFNVVPHVGLRWTQISTDSFEAGYKTDIDDMNVFQMPVGITVSGDVEVGGWTASPMFDLSFVPTFGDKNAEMSLGIAGVKASDDLSVRVVDSNPVQATLGINAVNGAWSFGLDYKLGVGSDDRMNNSFNARVNYAF